MKKKKTKEMRLPTRFNPGTHKFEPVLPTLVKGKKVKFKDLMSSIVKSDTRTDKEIFESNQEKIRQSCGDGAGNSLNFSKLEKL